MRIMHSRTKRKRVDADEQDSQVWYEDPLGQEMEESDAWDGLLCLRSVVIVYFRKVRGHSSIIDVF